MATSIITADQVRKLLNYDPDTGSLTWRVSFRANVAGSVAGSLHKRTGYRRVGVLGEKHLVHRVAWLIHHGEWPNVIDHINGVRDDNRLENLRSTNTLVNTQNRRTSALSDRLFGAQHHKATGLWRAVIRHKTKKVHIGLFATEQEAHAAYIQAKRLLHDGNTL